MNNLQKMKQTKLTENGDKSFKTTGNNYTDIMFLTEYLENHLDEIKIGKKTKDKVLSMYIRDPRFGMGKRKLGRKLCELSEVTPENIVLSGRFDDLLSNPTDENIEYLKKELMNGNELAKKWMPRLKQKDKMVAKELCKMWGINEKEYRKLIKVETTEYKLSYAKNNINSNPLEKAFNKDKKHPLVDTIKFEEVPSMAMKKYIKCFTRREDLSERFDNYMQKVKENKTKINVNTTNVYDAYKTAGNNKNDDILANKMLENQTKNISLDCLVIHDSSGSMYNVNDSIGKANSIALALATKSTYCPNQLISFSNNPYFIEIKGKTLQEKYESFETEEVANTDFGKVMRLCGELNKYPEYFVCLSDMEFDNGSYQSKEEAMKIIKEKSHKTKIIWWNLNSRNATIPELDEYGNIYLSGYSIKMLELLENNFNMEEYIDKILEKYIKDIKLLTKYNKK